MTDSFARASSFCCSLSHVKDVVKNKRINKAFYDSVATVRVLRSDQPARYSSFFTVSSEKSVIASWLVCSDQSARFFHCSLQLCMAVKKNFDICEMEMAIKLCR